ncbi:acyl-CoA carboxylase epsilon subunit [Streptomyces sp. NPDC006463]|uniref:acyl-CoA carboxylase epsilon subunit n=1 Tax=Streptomyces sp. NPDC006463 TaxID=3364746 RepID=UPI0036D027C3
MPGTPLPAVESPLAPALFKIINGRPTPEELAAVAALLTALVPPPAVAGRDAPADPGPSARWDRSDILPPTSWAARP